MQFVVFEKYISAYLHQIAREIMLLLLYNFMKIASLKVKTQDGKNLGSARARSLSFALVLHEKCSYFQSTRRA